MAFTPISNTVPQYEENGVAASGYFIKFYESGTTTPTAMATDSTGTTLLDKCELNTEGYPVNGSNAVFIPHINKKYKIALFRNAADANANDLASAVWEVDNLSPVVFGIVGKGFDQIPLNSYIRIPSDFIFEGDSITDGNTTAGAQYSDLFQTLSFAKDKGTTFNFAVGGSTVADVQSRYTGSVYPLRPSANGGTGAEIVYLFLMVGTNDLDTRFGNDTAANVITAITSYTQTAMADGFTVVLQTILPRISNQNGWNVQTEKYRQDINANIRRGSIPADIVADTESFVNDVTSGTMFHDGIHPAALGADMIAVYLNNVMNAGGSLEAGNVIQGRAIQGIFESKDKTVLSVGSQYCKTSLGTDTNENKNGFLTYENLTTSNPDSALWFTETGVSGDALKFLAVGAGGSGSAQAFELGRDGVRTWLSAGNIGQRTILGTPQSDSDSAPIYTTNLSAGLAADEANWGIITNSAADARPASLTIRTVDDSFSGSNVALELKRTGNQMTSIAVNGSISTTGVSISPQQWQLGSIKAGTGLAASTTKYVQVEIGGTLVNLAVVNDPTPS